MENTSQRVTQQFEGSMESLGDVLEVRKLMVNQPKVIIRCLPYEINVVGSNDHVLLLLL